MSKQSYDAPHEDGPDEFTGHVSGCAWVECYAACTCPPKPLQPSQPFDQIEF